MQFIQWPESMQSGIRKVKWDAVLNLYLGVEPKRGTHYVVLVIYNTNNVELPERRIPILCAPYNGT